MNGSKLMRAVCVAALLAATAGPAFAQSRETTGSSPGAPHASAAKGAVAGGVAGHMMGGHTKTGAVAGAMVGHHERKKEMNASGGG